jgi:CRISPR-associated protein Cas1
VASIIITSFSASIHSHLFLEAAKHGVALIICEEFKPVSLVLPANRSTDTLLTRALLKLDEKTRARMWQATVDAKCGNQLSLAEHLHGGARAVAPEGGTDGAVPSILERMRATARGKHPHKEATCARLFWQCFGRAMGEEDFSRDRQSGGLNSLLNYGYAVLLSTVLQKLFAVGLDPTWGLSHAPRERATPLAYDLMEPFRPWVTAFPLERVEYLGFDLEVRGCIEGVVRGFRKAVLGAQPRLYRPWTPKNSKWAG